MFLTYCSDPWTHNSIYIVMTITHIQRVKRNSSLVVSNYWYGQVTQYKHKKHLISSTWRTAQNINNSERNSKNKRKSSTVPLFHGINIFSLSKKNVILIKVTLRTSFLNPLKTDGCCSHLFIIHLLLSSSYEETCLQSTDSRRYFLVSHVWTLQWQSSVFKGLTQLSYCGHTNNKFNNSDIVNLSLSQTPPYVEVILADTQLLRKQWYN